MNQSKKGWILAHFKVFNNFIKNLKAAAARLTCHNISASQSSDNAGVIALRCIAMPKLTSLQDRTCLPA